MPARFLPSIQPLLQGRDFNAGDTADAPQAVSVNVVDVPGGLLPQSDNVELRPDEVGQLVNEAAENFAYAEEPLAGTDETGET